jgi:hypothetical protein
VRIALALPTNAATSDWVALVGRSLLMSFHL